MNPWLLELIVVRGGSHHASERQSLARDVERGLLHRLRRGVYVDRIAFQALKPTDQHIVRMRALAAVAGAPPVFSHWSAAAVHGLPFLGPHHLARVHTTVHDADARGQDGVFAHTFPLFDGDVEPMGSLLVTTPARTAVDISRARPFVEGVVITDAVLHAGVPRELLEVAVDLAERLRGSDRAEQVLAFARAESESALESVSRHSQMLAGIPPLVLQHEVRDRRGFAGRLDFWDPRTNSGGEADGESKYLELAVSGAAKAVIAEKWREDRLRASLNRLARWGWEIGRDPLRLAPVLAAAAILPSQPRATLSDYCRPYSRRKSH